jgi:hypothetical protein
VRDTFNNREKDSSKSIVFPDIPFCVLSFVVARMKDTPVGILFWIAPQLEKNFVWKESCRFFAEFSEH